MHTHPGHRIFLGTPGPDAGCAGQVDARVTQLAVFDLVTQVSKGAVSQLLDKLHQAPVGVVQQFGDIVGLGRFDLEARRVGWLRMRSNGQEKCNARVAEDLGMEFSNTVNYKNNSNIGLLHGG